MEKLKIGIVGAGAIAQRNAIEAARSGAAELVGVFDVNHKVAREMAKRLSIRFAGSYEELLSFPGLEAVLISTPHFLHVSQAVAAARAGKHILIEKPIANTTAEAREIIEACRTHQVKLTANYSFRFTPRIIEAKKLVDEGPLGEITGMQILAHQYKDPGYWTGAKSNSPDDWRASKAKSGGGLLIMTTCHVVDYMYYITGLKAKRVYCEYDTLNSTAEVEDIYSISCRFENGSIGTISASSIMRGYEQNEELIWGTKGTLRLDSEGLHYYSTRPIRNKKPGKMHRIAKFPEVSWTAEWIKDFAAAVREDRAPAVSHIEAWENIAFIEAAYRSLEKKQAIEIPEYEELWN